MKPDSLIFCMYIFLHVYSVFPLHPSDGGARASPRSHDAFAWPAAGLLPASSYDSPLLCPYKVPSGSKLPTRDMAYYQA
ncbi:hypothetical protein BGY98DRAFT_950094 [Russula aff. rugulosa BPL654]|nr:hypothetical protein BGY98DRAFT_950094 [Russula aff. rugulosa BPL654]